MASAFFVIPFAAALSPQFHLRIRTRRFRFRIRSAFWMFLFTLYVSSCQIGSFSASMPVQLDRPTAEADSWRIWKPLADRRSSRSDTSPVP